VIAENTDAPALVAELRRLAPERTPAQWSDVILRARSAFDPLTPTSRDRDALTIVQATSAGMHGGDPGGSVAGAVAWNDLPNGAIALDVVYNPPETPFLAAAKSRGLRSANGLGMLVEQGALAFELWLGQPAPRDVMRAALAGRS
jgi:shikimate 5-dehydrogenase